MTGENARHICWFSDGVASAVAARFHLRENPEAVVANCETGSEDEDNLRFRADCSKWFGVEVLSIKNPDFADNYAVWEKRRYMSGIAGAPCTSELKILPRLNFQRPDDVHIFGYTFDSHDIKRFENLKKNYPDLIVRAPLIERKVTKADCLGLLMNAGLEPPRTYAMGFPNANCLQSGCVKATSPNYWSLFRQQFPERFAKTAAVSRDIGCRLARVKNERVFIDEIPADWPTTKAIAPSCDFLCHLEGQDL